MWCFDSRLASPRYNTIKTNDTSFSISMLRSRSAAVNSQRKGDIETAALTRNNDQNGPSVKAPRYHGSTAYTRTTTFIAASVLFLVGLVVTAVISSAITKKSIMKQGTVVPDPSNPTSEFYSAYKESFGFFNDIPNSSWQLIKDRVRNRVNHLFPDNPMSHSILPWMWYQDNVSFACFGFSFEIPYTRLMLFHSHRLHGLGFFALQPIFLVGTRFFMST